MAVEIRPYPDPGSGSLVTKRLVLRPFRLSDGPLVEAFAGDFDVARMLTSVPHPYPAGEAQRWIEGHEAGRAAGRDFPFAIEKDGAFAGCAALDRETDGRFHLGYWVAKPLWGMGVATEAARAVAAFAFDELGVPEVKSGHFTDNHASGRVMTKLGFRYVKESFRSSAARGVAARFLETVLTRDRFKR